MRDARMRWAMRDARCAMLGCDARCQDAMPGEEEEETLFVNGIVTVGAV